PGTGKEMQQDGGSTNPQGREIEVLPGRNDEGQLSQRSSVRTGSLDSRVTEGDSMAFGVATLDSTGKEIETRAHRVESGPPKGSEPRSSNVEVGAQNLISSKLFDIEATVDSKGEFKKASALERGQVHKNGSGSYDEASLARKESREND